MRVRDVLLCLAVLEATLLAPGAPAQPAAPLEPRAERPTYAIGEKWHRADGTFELTAIEPDRHVFKAPGGQEIHLSPDFTVARTLRGGTVEVEFLPPIPLEWPLVVGKSGTSRGSWVWGRSAPASVAFSWTVEAYEDVRVPAGTFKAFRILQSWGGLSGGLSGGQTHGKLVAWYVPDVRQWVKSEVREVSPPRGALPLTVRMSFEVVRVALPAPEPVAAAPARSGPPVPSAPVPGRPTAAAAGASGPPPFQVTIGWPQDQARVDRSALVLAGLVFGGMGVSHVVVGVNGAEIARIGEPSPQPALAVSVPVKLREGTNLVVVTATAADGTVRRETRTVHYDPPPLPLDHARVTYRVKGTARSAMLTYRNAQGGTEQRDVVLPVDSAWEASFEVGEGAFLYVSAQNRGEAGSLTCEILVNGRSLTTSTSDGAYVVSTCDGTAPAGPR